jgi:hypothetical protein
MLDMSGLPERVKYLENTETKTLIKKEKNIFEKSVIAAKEGFVSSYCSTIVSSLAKRDGRSFSFDKN